MRVPLSSVLADDTSDNEVRNGVADGAKDEGRLAADAVE
jgi:hypothetical protein